MGAEEHILSIVLCAFRAMCAATGFKKALC